jgi:SsrA-binding protein
MAQKKSDPNYRIIAEYRRARYDYAIESDIECGVMLMGSEVKSLREKSGNIAESYAAVEEGELWLVNSYIAPYEQAQTWGHVEKRRRKLLVSKRELSRLWNATQTRRNDACAIGDVFQPCGPGENQIGHRKGQKEPRQTRH